ncbi:monovalent cation/H(+) antiporter subunit G [Aureimonas populi]|uniref:Monovalent cation/H(+) antiporter subunit G n=1 Tax=Aureimonas populi TaxID=1701758 RepID=A0ABW5CSW8_9HYPH|nr:monovalent cation/H(+) antiporter subunit G [Aureimonas populi]
MSDWFAALLLVSGGFFCLVAGIGVLRLGDVYCRMHAATKAGTMGLALVALAMMVRADSLVAMVEPFAVFLFMIATAPVGAHLIGRAALRSASPVVPETSADEGCEAFDIPAKQSSES